MTKTVSTTAHGTALTTAVLGRRPFRGWLVSGAATVTTTYGVDLAATGFGLLLVAPVSGLGLAHRVVVAAWVASYVVWWLCLRVNLRANVNLLERTGASTNLLSKGFFDLAIRLGGGRRTRRLAACTAYLAAELALEVPYYVGAPGCPPSPTRSPPTTH